MKPASRIDLRLAAGFCAVVGLYDTLLVIFTMTGGPVIGPVVDVLFPDFLVFHAATQAFFEGKPALIYDIDAFTRFQTESYPDRLPPDLRFRPFFYPPVWLLMLLPLGMLAVAKAYAVFMIATAAAATFLEGRRDLWGWLAVMTSPASMGVLLAGQNTFLSVALLYGGLRLLDRTPAVAGVLLGMLSYKPQIWLLVPLALLAARQWRALAWALGTVTLLVSASFAVFGADLWLAFLDASRESMSTRVAEEMLGRVSMHITTLFAAARIVGLSPAVAAAVQLAGAVVAVAAVWYAFRHHGSSDARTAVLVTATFLISPYALNYDLLLLMPAVVALFRQAARQGFHPLERIVYPALWLTPTFGLILNRLGFPLMPLIILLFGGIAWTRLRSQPKVELPETAAAR